MKAIVITEPGGPEVLQLREVKDPEPAADQLLVSVKATALNRADLLQRLGSYPPPPGVPVDIPGLEFSGVVEAVGREARTFKQGDRVMGLLAGGGYAEKVVTPESMALPSPESWSNEEAAAFPEAYLTAFDALFQQLGMQMGETLLIHAIGSGVGLAALQLATAAGITVLGTSRSSEKLKEAQKHGLDLGIHCVTPEFSKKVFEFTGSRGVDAIVDFIGAPYWQENLESLAPLGRIILVGLLGGGETETNLALLMKKRVQVLGTLLRSRSVWEKAQLTHKVRQQVLPLAELGRIRPVIDRVFPLSEAAAAHAYMEENKNFGKILLKVD